MSNIDKLDTVSTTSTGKTSSLFTKARHKSCSRASLVQQQQQPAKQTITESLTDLTGGQLKRMKSLPPKKKRRAPSPPKNVMPYRPVTSQPQPQPDHLHLPLKTDPVVVEVAPAAAAAAPEGVKVRRRAKAPEKHRQSIHLGNDR